MSGYLDKYDNDGDSGLTLFKQALWGLCGAIIGSLVYIVLLCGFSVDSLIFLGLSGVGAIAFYGAIGKSGINRWYDHIILIIDSFISVLLTNIFVLFVHVIPCLTTDIFENRSAFQKFALILKNSKISEIFLHDPSDTINISIYLELLLGFICALIGLYIAFAYFAISKNNNRKNNEKFKKQRKNK